MKSVAEKRKNIYRIVAVALMAALVYVGNYLQIPIPNGVLITRIHFGNSMCLLAGLLFGGLSGGLASGIGAGLYDLFTPAFVLSAPYTFISKFAMGFTTGYLRKRGNNGKKSVLISAIVGQIVYIVLYLVKSYFTVIIVGGTSEAAWAAVGTNALTSTVNAIIAVVVSVPLYFALSTALKTTEIGGLIYGKPAEKKGWLNPVTASLTAFAVVVTVIYTINLSAVNKIKANDIKKEEAYQQQIDDLTTKLEYLYSEMGVEMPAETEEAEAK